MYSVYQLFLTLGRMGWGGVGSSQERAAFTAFLSPFFSRRLALTVVPWWPPPVLFRDPVCCSIDLGSWSMHSEQLRWLVVFKREIQGLDHATVTEDLCGMSHPASGASLEAEEGPPVVRRLGGTARKKW